MAQTDSQTEINTTQTHNRHGTADTKDRQTDDGRQTWHRYTQGNQKDEQYKTDTQNRQMENESQT